MKTLREGVSGPEVTFWQKFLGMDDADGIFGPQTQATTAHWQTEHGLLPDGIVGLRTLVAVGWHHITHLGNLAAADTRTVAELKQENIGLHNTISSLEEALENFQ